MVTGIGHPLLMTPWRPVDIYGLVPDMGRSGSNVLPLWSPQVSGLAPGGRLQTTFARARLAASSRNFRKKPFEPRIVAPATSSKRFADFTFNVRGWLRSSS